VEGYLADYGKSGLRREKVWKWLFVILGLLILGGITEYFLTLYGTYNLRDIRPQWQARRFFSALEAKNYDEAYRLWGCTAAAPCRDYSKQKFLEDWGAQSPRAAIAKRQVKAVRHCETGIIEVMDLGPDDPLNLYVDRKDLSLSFAPWPVCNPRMHVGQ
jgi:hypothetical protein